MQGLYIFCGWLQGPYFLSLKNGRTVVLVYLRTVLVSIYNSDADNKPETILTRTTKQRHFVTVTEIEMSLSWNSVTAGEVHLRPFQTFARRNTGTTRAGSSFGTLHTHGHLPKRRVAPFRCGANCYLAGSRPNSENGWIFVYQWWELQQSIYVFGRKYKLLYDR